MERAIDLTQPGHFVVGCNYCASRAGTRLWSDWRPEVVERDFKLLRDAGLQVFRCMGAATREQAFAWTATIANTIRVADASRPVISGLHGLSTTRRN